MKIKTYILIAAALVSAASCQKNNIENVVLDTISVTSDCMVFPTKAALNHSYDVLWAKNDKILVKDCNGKKSTFTLQSGIGTNQGIFKQDDTQALSAGDKEVFYPTTLMDGGKLIWPDTQESGKVTPLYVKQWTVNSTDPIKLNNLGGMLEISITSALEESVALKSIEIRDHDKRMSGEFTISDGRAVITTAPMTVGAIENEDRKGVLVSLNGYNLGLNAKTVYVTVPSGLYEKPFLLFTDTNDKQTLAELDPFEVKCGEITQVKAVATEEFQQAVYALDRGKYIFMKWVQFREGGSKFAEKPVGALLPKWPGALVSADLAVHPEKTFGRYWKCANRTQLQKDLVDFCILDSWDKNSNDYPYKTFAGKEGFESSKLYLAPAGWTTTEGKVYDEKEIGDFWSNSSAGGTGQPCYMRFSKGDAYIKNTGNWQVLMCSLPLVK